MSLYFPEGTVFSFSTVIGPVISASDVSNSNPAVATVSTGINDGDVLVISASSSWDLANNAVAKAKVGALQNSVSLLGIDSSETELYPVGKANMKLSVASYFMEFDQQGDPTTAGGEQQFWTGRFLESKTGRQIQVPTYKNASTLTLPLFFDPRKPWYAAAKKADAFRDPLVLKGLLPNGDALYRYGYLSFNGDPSIAANTPMGNTLTFTALGETTLVEADQ